MFITFEGGEGTGKTTQIRRLEEKIKKELDREVCVTWEPGGTPLGEKIRSVLLDPNTGAMSARCEALLYAATRAEHVEKVIRPALARGAVVLCDRYWDASRAYQGIARGLGVLAIDDINSWGTQGLIPDLTFLFDLDPVAGLKRALERAAPDRMESEGMDFHQRVRQAYINLSLREPSRFERVDASQGVEEIALKLWTQVSQRLREPQKKPLQPNIP